MWLDLPPPHTHLAIYQRFFTSKHTVFFLNSCIIFQCVLSLGFLFSYYYSSVKELCTHFYLSMRIFLLDRFLEVQLLGKSLGNYLYIFGRFCLQKTYVTKFNSLKGAVKKFASLSVQVLGNINNWNLRQMKSVLDSVGVSFNFFFFF